MGKSNLDKERIEHPSFATISISRISVVGDGMSLFDSPFKHRHAIAVEISPADLTRDLHGDRVSPTGEVAHIRVFMSEIQFANLVLNANMHGGIPCTVDRIGVKKIQEPPERNLKKLWASEVKKDFKDVAEAAEQAEKEVDALLAKDRVTKADLKTLKSTIFGMAQDIRENMPWMQERFQEAMEKTVAAAKGEIEAHLANTIKQAGLTALKGGSAPLGLELGDSSEKKDK